MVHPVKRAYSLGEVDSDTAEKFKRKYGLFLGCHVIISSTGAGTICWFGNIDGEDLLGICLGRQKGNCDGTYLSKRYFTCTEGYGLIRPIPVWKFESPITLTDLPADGKAMTSLLNEVFRTFQCRCCFSTKASMVFCGGCKQMVVCQNCRDGRKTETATEDLMTRCPVCSFDWTWSSTEIPYTIQTNAFHSLLNAASEVQQLMKREQKESKCDRLTRVPDRKNKLLNFFKISSLFKSYKV